MVDKNRYFWLIWSIIFFIFLWLASDILLPFVVGVIIAYILNPSLLKLKKLGLGHKLSVSILLLISFVIFVGTFLFLVPLFIEQFSNLIAKMPAVFDNNYNFVLTYLNKLIPNNYNDFEYAEILYNLLIKESEKIIFVIISILQSAIKSGIAFINILGLLIITPIVSWYILSDWAKLIKFVKNLVPKNDIKKFTSIIKQSDSIISSFFRGQLTVSVILAVSFSSLASSTPFITKE